MRANVELVFDARNIVGESAVWDNWTMTLDWVDIVAKKISLGRKADLYKWGNARTRNVIGPLRRRQNHPRID